VTGITPIAVGDETRDGDASGAGLASTPVVCASDTPASPLGRAPGGGRCGGCCVSLSVAITGAIPTGAGGGWPARRDVAIAEGAERGEKASGASRGVRSRFMGLISLARRPRGAGQHRPTTGTSARWQALYGVVARFRRSRSPALTRPVSAADGPPAVTQRSPRTQSALRRHQALRAVSAHGSWGCSHGAAIRWARSGTVWAGQRPGRGLFASSPQWLDRVVAQFVG
jgi:hypothetical protein